MNVTNKNLTSKKRYRMISEMIKKAKAEEAYVSYTEDIYGRQLKYFFTLS